MNIAGDVRWSRVEETCGEDPLLASLMASAFVRAFESRGIIATPKHFVANVGDGGRDRYPIERSRRWLEENAGGPPSDHRSAVRGLRLHAARYDAGYDPRAVDTHQVHGLRHVVRQQPVETLPRIDVETR